MATVERHNLNLLFQSLTLTISDSIYLPHLVIVSLSISQHIVTRWGHYSPAANRWAHPVLLCIQPGKSELMSAFTVYLLSFICKCDYSIANVCVGADAKGAWFSTVFNVSAAIKGHNTVHVNRSHLVKENCFVLSLERHCRLNFASRFDWKSWLKSAAAMMSSAPEGWEGGRGGVVMEWREKGA